MTAYTVHTEHRFADGSAVRVGDLWRDSWGSIRDTYRVDAIRRYRRDRSIQVAATIVRRDHNGDATEPMIETEFPIDAVIDGSIVRATEDAR